MTGLASHVNLQVVNTEDTFLLSFLDPRLTEGPIKSPLSVRLSVCQFGIFLRNGSLFFSSDFLHDGR